MSVYQVHKFLYGLETDETLLQAARSNLASALSGYKLTDEEREALLAGDVARLYRMGVHGFLLNSLTRAGVIDRDTYRERIKAARPGATT